MRNPEPLVTVVIPAYKAEAYLERTVRSARAQTVQATEILIIDDGSPDGTAALADALATQDARIIVHHTPNRGVAAARNLGIDRARAPFVAFLDADDLWHPTKLKRQLDRLHQLDGTHRVGAVYAWIRFIDEDDRYIKDGVNWREEGDILARHVVFNFAGGGSTVLCPTDIAREVGGFDSGASKEFYGAEDHEFQLKVAQRYRFAVPDGYVVGYRQHRASMSQDIRRMARSRGAVIERHISEAGWLSPAVIRTARASNLVYEIEGHARANSAELVRTIARLAATDPVRLASEAVRFPLLRARDLKRAMTRQLGGQAASFNEMSPDEGNPPRMSPVSRARLLRLAREDRKHSAPMAKS